MSDYRAFHVPAESAPAAIRLEAAESHHLVAVNRCGRGDPVVVFDGRGHEWLTECEDASKDSAVLRVKSARPVAPRPHDITLAPALPKGTAMDDIVRQATEIGAARIVPLLSERTQVHLDADRQDRKLEKWRVAAIEAAKQCGNPWLPEIAPIERFEAFIATAKIFDLKLVASLHGGATTLKQALAHHRARAGGPPRHAVWLVGPEGDFSPAEMTAAITAGFQPITLGPLVLRSDTAACYALSILSYELGSM
ncbi:MAG TPA: RsmE family RNA methyltransferase [Lacunisphaera sp.]|jgi:16S rRNA (uracil1498-N3)-methyltransferase|nr:RsmE family RNA methyltransferase [Lacunisphaera sp.]